MNKLFGWLTNDIFKSITGVIDDLFTSDEERQNAKNMIQQVLMEKSLELETLKADIIQSEAKGNWLQRSWRPIVMLAFAFIVVYSKFVAPCFNLPNTTLEPDFWNLLQLGIGGYVVGRSLEKITKDVSPNIEIKRKRNEN